MKETNISNKMSARKLLCYLILCLCLVGFDQWSKWKVLTELSGGRVVTPLPGILQFRYLENTGAAFSVLTGKTVALTVVTAVILLIAVLLLVFDRVPGTWNQVALVLMAAGGAGNLIDRIARHYVVDFIEVLFTRFAVFNFADCCVTIGAALLILSTLVSFVKESGENKD